MKAWKCLIFGAVVMSVVQAPATGGWWAAQPSTGVAAAEVQTPSDGEWSSLYLAISEAAVIYDPVRDRMLAFGGNKRNEIWELSPLSASPTCVEVLPLGTAPPLWTGHSAIYDPVRDRAVIFVGDTAWALSLSGVPTWSEILPSGSPPIPRSGHSAIYDPVRDRMVVFGGGEEWPAKVWFLSLSATPTWTSIEAPGSPPPFYWLERHTAIYDPVRDRMLVFGGHHGSNFYNDTWALTLAGSPAWTEVQPSSGTRPTARSGHAAFYDPIRDRMIVFGGQTELAGPQNDTWALTLSGTPNWIKLQPAGGPPPLDYDPEAVYDPARDRMLVAEWQERYSYTSTASVLWALSLGGSPVWSELFAQEELPPRRDQHATVYDQSRQRVMVFGGACTDNTWAVSLSGLPTWNEVHAGLPYLSPLNGRSHSAIYDWRMDRMIVFGGGGCYVGSNDAWELTLFGSPTWTQLQPSGLLPPIRNEHTAVYDWESNRMIVFGGFDGVDYVRNDTWQLSLSGPPTWTEIQPSGDLPAPRSSHSAIYEPVSDRMIVFGGWDGYGGLRNDVWQLSLSGVPTWIEIQPTGDLPPARYDHTAVYDPGDGRMIIFGGEGTGGARNDTWALPLSDSPAWDELHPEGSAPAVSGHAAIYDARYDRLIVLTGDSYNVNAAYVLTWGTPTSVGRTTAKSSLLTPYPNPFNPSTTISFVLAKSGHVDLTIYDLLGARVVTLVDDERAANSYRMQWDGTNHRGQRVASGIYFCRLRTGGFSATRKIVLLK